MATNLKDIAALLHGISSLAWPLVALLALLMFRPELKLILSRFKRGKLLGSELELGESLSTLEKSIAGASVQVPLLPEDTARGTVADEPDADLLAKANGDPKLALVLTAGAIEKELREILAVTGLHGGHFNLSSREMLRSLQEHGMVPAALSGTIDAFWQLRNQIVHARGGGASEDEALRALDSGLALLRLLRAIPRATYVVVHAKAPVFFDAEGQRTNEALHAVLVEQRDPGGIVKATRAYPTTRSHYVIGKRVAWEWNPELTFGESWYRDPASGEIRYGWTGSMEFVGRLLDDL